MKQVYRVKLVTGEWLADFACLETAQKFVGNDEQMAITPIFKMIKRSH